MSKKRATKKRDYRSGFLPFAASAERRADYGEQHQCGCRPAIGAEQHMEICDGLIDILAALFTVSGRQLRSPKRDSKDIARVRQIGMYVARVTLCLNVRLIADGFARDKSTVTYACHLIEDLRDDPEFDFIVSGVERVVSAAFKYVIPLGQEGSDEH